MLRHFLTSLSLAAAVLAACGEARPPVMQLAAAGPSACSGCHGSAENAAPPRSVGGATATTDRAVGAHQSHVRPGPMAGAIACEECHPARPGLSAPGHVDGKVDVAFRALASKGTAAAWNGATCAVYCHGATLSAGSVAAPTWTRVDGTQAACGACHGLPPTALSRGGLHPAVPGGVTACASCHPQTVRTDGTIDVAGGMHVNGTVEIQGIHPAGWSDLAQHGYAANRDLASCRTCHGATLTGGSAGVSCDACHTGGTPAWRTTCTFCHGDASRPAALPENRFAPPLGTQGETLASQPAVGAHQRHLNGSANAAPVACTECHAVGAITDIAHVDGAVQLTFGTLATTGGRAPAYDGASCSATYCHGGFSGGSSGAPSWTGGAMACTSCHGIAPSTGEHQRGQHVSAGCAACHGTGYSTTTARAADHPNGVRNVGGAGSQVNSWNAATLTCAPACHGNERW